MPLLDAQHALVVRTEVSHGAAGLGDEPVTTAELAVADGSTRLVAVVGGPGRAGGTVRLAGKVVPRAGDVVRLDLADDAVASLAAAALPNAWTANDPAGPWTTAALPVPFALALGASGAASRDLATADAAAEVDVALRAWTLVGCTAWRSTFAGTLAGLVPGDDGVNAVFWHDDVWPAELGSGAVGQTVLHVDATGHYHDADVHLNGAMYTWSLDGHGATVDARSVLTHELGHALGLGHSTVPGATMSPSVPVGIAARSLEQDDRAGVCTIYPGTGAPGCEVSPACPAGYVCVARYCERTGARGETCAPCQRVTGVCAGSGDDARCIDVGDGGTTGLVCGRACTGDADCGPRFRCLPTTSSGDLQCVSPDGCATGPDPCATDADCGGDAGAAVCRGGACVGPPPAADDDGGAEASSEAAMEAPSPRGAGCSAAGGSPRAARAVWAVLAILAALSGTARRPRSRRASPGTRSGR